MKSKLIAALLLLPSIAFAESKWLGKPVLCGPTQNIVKDFLSDEYVPVAHADIVRDNGSGPVIGKLLYFVKDDELFMVESFSVTNISCIVGLYKNFAVIKKSDKGPTY